MHSVEAPTEATIETWLDQPQVALSGHTFTPSAAIWRPDISQRTINVSLAKPSVPEGWQLWLVAALAYYLRQMKQGSISNLAWSLKKLAKLGLNPLDETGLIKIREQLDGSVFGAIASFIKFWNQCEELSIRPSRALVDAYNDLPRKPEHRRDVVTSLDPMKGPYTPYERDALFHWVCGAYVDERLSLDRFVYLRLLFVYGARAANLQQMVFGDFRSTDKGYQIRLPKVKGRGEKGGFRKELVNLRLSDDLYQLISGYKRYVLERLKQEYPGRACWDLAINNVPVFRRLSLEKGGSRRIILDSDALKGLEVAPDSQFHIPAITLKKWVEDLRTEKDLPISERTGDKIYVHTHRFRHTVGTDMAVEGYSAPAIAAALTHKGTSSTGKYIKTSITLAKRIDAKLQGQLALVVNAFTGVIVNDRHAAHYGERTDRQIEDLAVCGSDSQCYLDAPLTCYPCSKFQPLLHADHQRALEELLDRQARSSVADQNTAAVYDRAILACRRVIHDCQRIITATEPHTEI